MCTFSVKIVVYRILYFVTQFHSINNILSFGARCGSE